VAVSESLVVFVRLGAFCVWGWWQRNPAFNPQNVKKMLLGLVAAGLTGCTITPPKPPKLLTKEDFKRSITVQDDALDTVAKFDTLKGFVEPRGFLSTDHYDSHLRAFVDKSTETVTYQLYQSFSYQAQDWNFFHTVNYETPNGPASSEVKRISSDVSTCSSRGLGCFYDEDVGVIIDSTLLHSLAENYKKDPTSVWKFKFTAKSSAFVTSGLMNAEIAALVETVDEYLKPADAVKAVKLQ
jgi:hypothetical protein